MVESLFFFSPAFLFRSTRFLDKKTSHDLYNETRLQTSDANGVSCILLLLDGSRGN